MLTYTITDKPFYYLFTASVNKCGGSCDNIDDPYAEICAPDKLKNINVKVFNILSSSA